MVRAMVTLAARMDQEDERRFVGRTRELALVDDVLAGRSAAHVLVVHGPGGIGKSTLLRQVRRQAERAGWATRALDGRDGLPTSSELEERIAAPGGDERGRLVLLDTYERISSLGPQLRAHVLPALPDRSLVVIAQRGDPDPGWLQGGWENVTRAVPLAPVSPAEARELMARDGLTDPEASAALLAWAAGSPLALTLGAEALQGHEPWRVLDDRPALADVLVRRLTEAELDPSHLDVVTVAAIARRTDATMLADVLPGVDGAQAETWLRGRTFAAPLGRWVTLHDLVRTALRTQARAENAEREHELRRRVAEHLYHRATAGEPGLMPDLAELVDNPAIRWGIPGEGPPGLRPDDATTADLEACAALVHHRGRGDWWDWTLALVRAMPRAIAVARDEQNAIAGLSIVVSAQDAPAAVERDPLLGPWLAHARAHTQDANALLWRDSLDLTSSHGDIGSRVLTVTNTAALLRSRVPNPRLSYLPIDPVNPAAVDFARVIGAQHIPELDVTFDGRVQQCHVLDHGPGGMLANHRATVYAELGLAAPAWDADPATAAGTTITVDTVKEALRNLDRPLELARSPLAHGQTVAERAESVRALVVAAAAGAFGATPAERLLHDVIVERYLGEPTTHERTAERLHVSRSTYFRHLGVAVDRLAEYALLARGDASPAA
jgi:hypothetical protein